MKITKEKLLRSLRLYCQPQKPSLLYVSEQTLIPLTTLLRELRNIARPR